MVLALEQSAQVQGAVVVVDVLANANVDVVIFDCLVDLSSGLGRRLGAEDVHTVGLDGRLHVDDLVSV